MIAEAAGSTFWERRMEDVVLHGRPLLGEVGVWLALRFEIDRGGVERAAAGAGEEGAVVVGIVPGEPALVIGIRPEADHELDRCGRLLAVQRHGPAVLLNLLAA